MTKRIMATARVCFTVELIAGMWDAESPLKSIHTTASREAIEKFNRVANAAGFRVVGEPKVEAIVVAKEE